MDANGADVNAGKTEGGDAATVGALGGRPRRGMYRFIRRARRPVGRAPKLHGPSPDAIRVSIPERRHELLARILADAVATGDPGRSAVEQALSAASLYGRTYGAEQRDLHRPGPLDTERALSLASACLEEFGFEPERAAPDLVVLHNCPFHPLAEQSPELVCGINQRFLAGFLDGLGAADRADAVLQPDPSTCCVRLCAAEQDLGAEPNP